MSFIGSKDFRPPMGILKMLFIGRKRGNWPDAIRRLSVDRGKGDRE